MSDELSKKLLSTTDSQIWAEEFCKKFVIASREDGYAVPTSDQIHLMMVWFGNAIEVGKQSGRNEHTKMNQDFVQKGRDLGEAGS